MAQTASRPSFNFIPQPIEAQMAGQQLGELLEVYQMGWKRDPKGDRRVSKLPAVFIIFVGVAAMVGSVIGIIAVLQSTHFIVTTLFWLPVLSIIILAVGVIGLFRSTLCVAVFSDGLVHAKNNHVTILHWQDIASCEQERKKTRYNGVVATYTIHTHAGKVVQWKTDYRLMQKIGKIIQEHISA